MCNEMKPSVVVVKEDMLLLLEVGSWPQAHT